MLFGYQAADAGTTPAWGNFLGQQYVNLCQY